MIVPTTKPGKNKYVMTLRDTFLPGGQMKIPGGAITTDADSCRVMGVMMIFTRPHIETNEQVDYLFMNCADILRCEVVSKEDIIEGERPS